MTDWVINIRTHFFLYTQAIRVSDAESAFYFTMILATVFFWPYFYCHFATMASENMSNIGDLIYTLNWYEFPLDIQKDFMLIMRQSQNNVYLTGFDLIGCTLLNYQRVCSARYRKGNRLNYTISYRIVSDDQIIGLVLFGIWYNECDVKNDANLK